MKTHYTSVWLLVLATCLFTLPAYANYCGSCGNYTGNSAFCGSCGRQNTGLSQAEVNRIQSEANRNNAEASATEAQATVTNVNTALDTASAATSFASSGGSSCIIGSTSATYNKLNGAHSLPPLQQSNSKFLFLLWPSFCIASIFLVLLLGSSDAIRATRNSRRMHPFS